MRLLSSCAGGLASVMLPLLCATVLIAGDQTTDHPLTTAEYIAQFDPAKYLRAGADYTHARYDPARIGKPLKQIDRVYDYDFARLEAVTERLKHVDRKAALSAIFAKLTAGIDDHTQRHLAVLRFLQQASYHHAYLQPMYPDKQAVFDPLILLELGEMRCGAAARVGADLFATAGYRVRLAQALAHVTTEIFYEGDWHWFEADMGGGGQVVMIDGRIPSLEQLAKSPFMIDRLSVYAESWVVTRRVPGEPSPMYPSYYFFAKSPLAPIAAAYYSKTATHEEAAASRWYGWNYYSVDTQRWPLADFEPKYEPAAPIFTQVRLLGKVVEIKWSPVRDDDHDLLGYRVYVSHHSRGWQHHEFSGSASAQLFFRGGWKPEMYDAMFQLPPHDAGYIETTKTSVRLGMPAGETKYVTVLAYDRHGESVGRQLYNMSEELTLTRDLSTGPAVVRAIP